MFSSIALRHFAEVARCGSLRAAADRLFVAPSAVSRQLSLLEDELGTPLFERTRGRTSMRITAAGEAVMSLVEKLEEEEERTRSVVAALTAPAKPVIRFALPESLARDFIPEFLVAHRKEHRDVEFEAHVVGSTPSLDMLRRDEIDLALVFNPLVVPGLKKIYERNLATCVLVAENHPLARRQEVTLEECARYPMVMPDASNELARVNAEVFERARLRPERVLASNYYELLRGACTAGLGIALLAEPLSMKLARLRSLRYVHVTGTRDRTFVAFIREGSEPPAAVKAFLAGLLRAMRAAEAEAAGPARKGRARSRPGNTAI